VRALGDLRRDLERSIDPREDVSEQRATARNDWLARDGTGDGASARGDAGVGGEVTGGEILFEREADDAVEEGGKHGGKVAGDKSGHESKEDEHRRSKYGQVHEDKDGDVLSYTLTVTSTVAS
jgi:hypothetical protein